MSSLRHRKPASNSADGNTLPSGSPSQYQSRPKMSWKNPSQHHRQTPTLKYIHSVQFFFPSLGASLTILLIITSIVFLNYVSGLLPMIVPDTAPLSEFSEERAMAHLDFASNIIGPHHYGTRENEYVAGYLEAKLLHYMTKNNADKSDIFPDPIVPVYESYSSKDKHSSGTETVNSDKNLRRNIEKARELEDEINLIPTHDYFQTTISNTINGQDIIFEYSRLPLSGHYFLDGFIDPRFSLTNAYSNLTNIAVRISPNSLEYANSQPAILLNSHFDSCTSSPGASDDGIGFVTMLEVTRILLELAGSTAKTLEYPVIFLFNAAEETLMHGSHAFISNHPWAENVAVVYNLEAAGTWGPEVLFQFRNSDMVRHYSKYAPHPHGTILAQDVFSSGVIPSDTDFRVFIDVGQVSAGMDLALYLNGYLYHTDLDLPKYILPGTAQHFGNNILGMVYNNIYTRHPWVEDALQTRKSKLSLVNSLRVHPNSGADSNPTGGRDGQIKKHSTGPTTASGAPKILSYSAEMRKKLLNSVIYFDVFGQHMLVSSVYPFIVMLLFSFVVGSIFFKWKIFVILMASFFASVVIPLVVGGILQIVAPYHWYSSWVLALSFYSVVSCFSALFVFSLLFQSYFDSLLKVKNKIIKKTDGDSNSSSGSSNSTDSLSFPLINTNIKGTLIFCFSLTCLVMLIFGLPSFGLIVLVPFGLALELVSTYILDSWWSQIPECFDFNDWNSTVSPSYSYFSYLWFRRVLNYVFRAFPGAFWIFQAFATTACIVSISGRMGPVPGEIVVALVSSLFSSISITPWIITTLSFGQSKSSWEETGVTAADAKERKRSNPDFLIYMRRSLFLGAFFLMSCVFLVYLLSQPAYRPLAPKRLMLQTSIRYPTEYFDAQGSIASISSAQPVLSFVMSRLDCVPITQKVVDLFHSHSAQFGQGLPRYHYPADPMNRKNVSLEDALDYFDSWSWEVFYPVNFLFEGYNFISSDALSLVDSKFQSTPFEISVESSEIVKNPIHMKVSHTDSLDSLDSLWKLTIVVSKRHLEWITLRVDSDPLIMWSIVDGSEDGMEIPPQHPLDFHYIRFISGVHFSAHSEKIRSSSKPLQDETWRFTLWLDPSSPLILHFNGCDQDGQMLNDFIDQLPTDHSAIYVNSVSLTAEFPPPTV